MKIPGIFSGIEYTTDQWSVL